MDLLLTLPICPLYSASASLTNPKQITRMSDTVLDKTNNKQKYKNSSPAKKLRNIKRLLTFLLNKSCNSKYSDSSLSSFQHPALSEPPMPSSRIVKNNLSTSEQFNFSIIPHDLSQQTAKTFPEIAVVPVTEQVKPEVSTSTNIPIRLREFHEIMENFVKNAFKPP